jgi:hypothetical protein
MTEIVIFRLTNHSGFFSVFFFLLKSYIYAKKNGFRFYIEHDNWLYTYNLGWHDYFNSLEVFNSNISFSSKIYYSHPGDTKNNNNENPINSIEFTLEEYIEAIKEICIFNNDIITKADEFISKIDSDFASIYVRRGDKITSNESPFFPTENILNYTNLKEFKNIFVQSDTYNTILEVKQHFPESNIYYTVPESKNGSFHTLFNNMNKNTVKNDTEQLFIGLCICLKSKICWTDDYSNVGRFLKLFDIEKVKLYPLSISEYDIDTYKNETFDITVKTKCPAYTNFYNLITNT